MSTSFPIYFSQITQTLDAPYPELLTTNKITHNTGWKFNWKYKLSRLCPLFLYQNVICVLYYHSLPPWCILQAVRQYYLSDHNNGATFQHDRIMPISSTYLIFCRPCYIVYYVTLYDITGVKANAIPVQAWTGLVGYKRMRLQDFKTIGTWRQWGCQPYVPPRKHSWYSFLLKAESIPGP